MQFWNASLDSIWRSLIVYQVFSRFVPHIGGACIEKDSWLQNLNIGLDVGHTNAVLVDND